MDKKMNKYIMREPVILAVNMAAEEFPYKKDPKEPETYSKYNEGWTDACYYIFAMIEAEDIADVLPIVHGYWESHLLPLAYKCSICGYKPSFRAWKYENLKFCPNCGAKMDIKNKL